MNMQSTSDGNLDRVLQALSAIIGATDKGNVLRLISNATQKLLNTDYVNIYLIDPEDSNTIRREESSKPKLRDEAYSNQLKDGHYHGLTGWVFATGQSLRLDDVYSVNGPGRPALLANLEKLGKKDVDRLKWYNEAGIAAQGDIQPHILIVPLHDPREPDTRLGVIRVASTMRNTPFTDEDEHLLQIFADHLGQFLTQVMKSAQVRDLLRLIGDANQNVMALLKRVASEMPGFVRGCGCSIFLEQTRGDYVLQATSCEKLAAEIGTLTYTEADHATKTYSVVRKRETSIWSNDGEPLEKGRQPNECPECEQIYSMIATPIIGSGNRVIGIIRVLSSSPDRLFQEEDRTLVEDFSKYLGLVFDRDDTRRRSQDWADAVADKDPYNALGRMLSFLSSEYDLYAAYIRVYDRRQDKWDALYVCSESYQNVIQNVRGAQDRFKDLLAGFQVFYIDNDVDKRGEEKEREVARVRAKSGDVYANYVQELKHALTLRIPTLPSFPEDDQPASLLCLRRNRGEPFSDEEVESIRRMLTAFAERMAALRVADRSLVKQMVRRGIDVANLPPLDELLHQLLINLRDILGNPRCRIKLIRRFNAAARQLELLASEPEQQEARDLHKILIPYFETQGEGGGYGDSLNEGTFVITDASIDASCLKWREQLIQERERFHQANDVINEKLIDEELAYRDWIKAVVAVPMMTAGELDGVLTTISDEPFGFSRRDVVRIEAFAQEVAPLLRVAFLRRDTELRTRRLRGLREATRFMLKLPSALLIYKVMLTAVTHGDGIGFCRAFILLRDENSFRMLLPLARGAADKTGQKDIHKKISIEGISIQQACDLAVETPNMDPDFVRLASKITLDAGAGDIHQAQMITRDSGIDWHTHICSVLECDQAAIAPIRGADANLGVVIVDNTFINRLITQEDLHMLEFVADGAGAMVMNRQYTADLIASETKAWADFKRAVSHKVGNKLHFASVQLSALRPEKISPPDLAAVFERRLKNVTAFLDQAFEGLREFRFADHPLRSTGTTDINALVREMVPHSRLLISEVEPDLDPDLPMVAIDKSYFKVILEEMVHNAHRAEATHLQLRTRYVKTPDGGSGYAELSVCNNGTPIPPDRADRIFTEMVTTRSDRGGSGYGLNSIYRIVTEHEGTIHIEPRTEGACFVIQLPVNLRKETDQ